MSGPDPLKDKRSRSAIARWIAAGIVAVGALLVITRTYFDSSARICRDAASDDGVVALCGPFGLQDALWLGAVGLVIAMILWLDISEVSVTGVGSLKRRVEDQEKKTAELERFVVGQLMNLSVTNTVTQNQTVVVTSERIRKALEIAEDERPTPREVETDAQPDRAVLVTRILELWESIALKFAETTGPARRHGRFADTEGRLLIDHPRLLSWYEDFKTPLNTFRAVRNAVAHPPNDLSLADLGNAVALGEQLLRSLNEALGDQGS